MVQQNRLQVAKLFERIFPKSPDFYELLHKQCIQVKVTVDNLTIFMASGDLKAGKMLKKDQHEANRLNAQNLHELNSAFSTPIDREDIYRAMASMDDIVAYCKSTYNEMKILQLETDAHSQAIASELQNGVNALEEGFKILGTQPGDAIKHAATARHSERRVEKIYRKALHDLFQGTDYLRMFKQRELYRHLSNAADRIHATANVLQDIVVKIT